MVDEDEYCVDILTQIVSVTKALQGVGLGRPTSTCATVCGTAETATAEATSS
jgi:DNA-binding FrmR family transcriptional regulator